MADPAARLPPLNALRVFQVVVRHRSLRAAADELRVSPQAVSQQIRLLEDTLGVALFDRKGRAVEPKEAAILLAHHVQAGFDEIAEGVRRVARAGQRTRINVNASPHFATRHLLDRLGQFRQSLPDAELRLTTMVDLPDFVRDDVDVAIQWGFGHWPAGLDRVLLMQDRKVICCTPAMAAGLTGPEALCRLPLLHPVLAEGLWADVLAHLGAPPPATQGDMRVDDAATMRRATLAGLGVGLISAQDAAEDLASGRLVAPFGTAVMDGMAPALVPGFWLVLPRAHRRVKAIAAFCDWVQGQDWQQQQETG